MKDFYGNELALEDRVLLGGGSQSLREGIIEKITDKYVTVRIYRNYRGEQTRKKYYHAVTGKWINPYSHRVQESGYYNKETGEKLSWGQMSKNRHVTNPSGWGYRSEPNPDYVPEDMREYRDTIFADYVKEVNLKGGGVSIVYDSRCIAKLPIV
jgi:hypothetical protein